MITLSASSTSEIFLIHATVVRNLTTFSQLWQGGCSGDVDENSTFFLYHVFDDVSNLFYPTFRYGPYKQ